MNSMKVWAKAFQDHRIQSDVVQEFALARPLDLYGWTQIIDSLCRILDIERPVILSKHIQDLNKFGRTVFRHSDFMDYLSFDFLEIEVFPENSKDKDSVYIIA